MRNILLSFLFFSLAPCMLIISVFLFSNLSHQQVLGTQTRAVNKSPFAYAALPTSENVFEGSATLSDKRIANLTEFLSIYHSPLAPYAQLFVTKADEYNIDYRLLPAIAMQETTLCEKTLPQAPFNCWGWGIWGKRVTSFHSFTDAIDTISQYFGKKKENGIASLDAIGSVYNPGNTAHWKEHVAGFMAEM